MAFNVPSYDKNNISFGPAVVYIGAWDGQTPTTDVGAVRSGGTLAITRTLLDVFQGSPRSLITTFVTQEDVSIGFTSIEWKLQNFQYVLGAGELTGTTKLDFGGDAAMDDLAVKVKHVRPDGTTINIYLWKARGSGEISTTFGDDVQEFPATFTALEATGDWIFSSLADKFKKMQIFIGKE